MEEKKDITPEEVEALKRGDEEAWNRFFARFTPMIHALVSWPKWSFPKDIQEEMAQIISIELVKRMNQYNPDYSMESFIDRVGAFRCLDQVRKMVKEHERTRFLYSGDQEVEQIVSHLETDEGFNPVEQIIREERALAIRRVLDQKLNESCREIIRDFYFRELSYKEIAEKLSLSRKAIGNRLSRCLDKLVKIMTSDSFFRG